MRLSLKRLTIGASTAVLGLLMMIGCGGEQSPLAQDSDIDNIASVEAGQSILMFSSPGLRPAAKGGDGGSDGSDGSDRTLTKTIGIKGGQLRIADDGPGKHSELVVTFDVPKKALRHKETITMEVSGAQLTDLVIRFSPAGLVFKIDARLSTTLEKGLYSPDMLGSLTVQHLDGDGNLVESITPSITVDDEGTVTITIPVPGFSRYGIRG